MLLFGLTGGVASGKSSVAAHFRSCGVPVIDADQIARDVVEPDFFDQAQPSAARVGVGPDVKPGAGLAAVVQAFGAGVLQPDGRLDRKALGAIVFGDASQLARLNAILHPRIAQEAQRRASELAHAGALIAGYEAALLVENGLAGAFRPLVVVAVEPATQLARLMARDGIDEAAARARIRSQLPLADKIAAADHVIMNEGSKAALVTRSDEVLAALRAAAERSAPPGASS